MKRRIFVVGAVALCFAASSAFAADVFSGNWKVNIAKSKYDPGPPPKGPNFSKIESIQGGLKFTNSGVNAEGQATGSEWSGKFDGKDNPVKGDPNRDTAALKKINDHTIEITNKKDGKVMTVTKVTFSKDGKSRSQVSTGTNAKGQKVNNKIEYEK